MEAKVYQERLVKLSRDFEKLVISSDVPRGTWKDFVVRYKGSEVFQGVLAENVDIVVKDVGKVQDSLEVLFSVRSSNIGKQNKVVTMYFDPTSPFYVRTSSGIIEPNTTKLKQQITFSINGTFDFDKEEINVGEVKEGSLVDFEFEYKGNVPLAGVKGTCGCTNVSINGNKISGQVNTSGFKNDWSKHVNVYLGDYENYYYSKDGVMKQNPNCSVIPLFIKGKVKN